jgi:hypothetical protein
MDVHPITTTSGEGERGLEKRSRGAVEVLVRQAALAVDALLPGLLAAARRAGQGGEGEAAEDDVAARAATAVVVRLLFLLCAEAVGLRTGGEDDAARPVRVSEMCRRLLAARAADASGSRGRTGAFGELLRAFDAASRGTSVASEGRSGAQRRLFDPEASALLEAARATVDDAAVCGVLEALTLDGGQSIDHGALDVEVVGSVYEALMDVRLSPELEGAGGVRSSGRDRRRTGSHYTPPALADRVVRRTMAPLLARLGPDRTAEQVLALRVCDPAMGAGAFLLATCRLLADEVVAAWSRCSEGQTIPLAFGDEIVRARRLVASRCLYGVDKNPLAVDLAKLSLWLLVGGPLAPLALDRRLRHGDSLVGLTREQMQAFHWAPRADDRPLRLDEAGRSAAQDERARRVGDACVGAFLAGRTGSEREQERARRLGLVRQWLERERGAGPADATAAEVVRLADEAREATAPMHFWLEFPEVFARERAAGFDAVVGNPPFLGGKRTSTELGASYADWVATVWHASKNADLSSRFFLRAADILSGDGAVGFIATNTIGQGDTRRDGLQRLLADGFCIYDAVRSMPWPGDAAVCVALVHLARGEVRRWTGEPLLDGERAASVTSHLRAGVERPDPRVLEPNRHLGFVGCFLRGDGFVLSAEEAAAMGGEAAVRPFLGGDEVMTSPTHAFHRHCVDFTGIPEEQAKAAFPRAFAHVARRVLPYRSALRDSGIDKAHKARWWQFGSSRDEMREVLAGAVQCLVVPRNPMHLCVVLQPASRVFSDQLVVLALSSYSAFAVLQSRVHRAWAYRLSSSLGEGLRYSVSDCFETFPFPEPDPRAPVSRLEAAGELLYCARAAFMTQVQQGLTKTYGALKDPRRQDAVVLQLRRLHEALDRAVLDAYGWQHVAVPPYCQQGQADFEAMGAFEAEVMDRLWALNAERAGG